MGFEVIYKFHPKKEEGLGYNTEKVEEFKRSVGEPFDETPLQKLADAIVSQFARRDIMVIGVSIVELTRKEISFKESKDGKAIMLKGKRFPLDGTSAPEGVEDVLQHNLMPHELVQQPQLVQQAQHVQHAQHNNLDDLYSKPNVSLAPKRQLTPMAPVNQKKVLYHVYFEPYFYEQEAKNLGLKFTEDKKYSVHRVVPHASGRLDAQLIIVTDDTGKPVQVEEKFFTSAGKGLQGDAELGFSTPRSRRRQPKLMYENEMVIDAPVNVEIPAELQGIPIDDGSVPNDTLQMPDIRPGKKFGER